MCLKINKSRRDYRSVVASNNVTGQHPVRDASLTGCKRNVMTFSTERHIPVGM